jgi:putative dehydrogenase
MAGQGSTVGMIGLGIMGSAMSRNLIAAGFRLVGFDVSPEAMDAFRGIGGEPAGSAGEVGTRASVIITCLPSVGSLDAVVAELALTPHADRVLAETSTFPVEDKERARDALAHVGIVVLDCPLSGSGSQARERDVLVYGSGNREAFDRALPVFNGFSRGPHYLGDFGAGSKTKFIANLLVAIHTAAAGEAFALVRKAGLDPAKTFEVVADGAGGSRAMQVRGPMLIADTYLPISTMPLNLWRKDMRVIADFVNSLACPTPLFSAAVPLFNAAVASGLGEQDTAAVCAVIETMAGLSRPSADETA